jgi:hypothetical protein
MASPFSLADRVRIVFAALADGQSVRLPSGHTVVLAQTARSTPTVGVVIGRTAKTAL